MRFEVRSFRFDYEYGTELDSCKSMDLLFGHIMIHELKHSPEERARQHLKHGAQPVRWRAPPHSDVLLPPGALLQPVKAGTEWVAAPAGQQRKHEILLRLRRAGLFTTRPCFI
jgi:hypothetical protein